MDVYDSSKWLFFVLKSIGLAPYSVDYKTCQFKMKFVNYLTFAVSIDVTLSLLVIQLIYNQECYFETGVQSKFLEGLWQNSYRFQHFLALFVLVFNFTRITNIENFMSFLHKFDQMIDKMDWQFKAKQIKTFSLFVLCIASATMLTVTIVVGFLLYPITLDQGLFSILTNSITYALVTELFMLISIQFIVSAYAVITRLEALTNNIR